MEPPRERRQCSRWRHEQLSVYSGEGEVHEQYDALWGPKPPLPGTRPAPLSEVAGPQGRLVVPAVVVFRRWCLSSLCRRLHMTTPRSPSSFRRRCWRSRRRSRWRLEAKLAGKEQRLLTHCGELRGCIDLRDQFTRLETLVISWAWTKWEINNRKKKRRRKKKLPKSSSFRSSRSVFGCRLRVRQWIHVHEEAFANLRRCSCVNTFFYVLSCCTRQVCLQLRRHEASHCVCFWFRH